MKYPLITFAFIYSTSAIADVDVSGTAETQTALSLKNGNLAKNELIVKPEVSFDISDLSKVTVIGRLRGDSQSRIDPDDQLDFSLREAYLDTEIGRTFLRLGKQQIVWGQADGLKVLDILNPQSFREFILPEFEESRNALWSVNAEIPVGEMTLQAIWIPETSYNEIPDADALFAFTSPLIMPQGPEDIAVDFEEGFTPSNAFSDSDVGLKLAAFMGGWDLTLNYAYHYYDNPVIRARLAEGRLLIRRDYERSHLIGGTFSNVFGDVTLRGEIGYSTDRYYITAGADPDALSKKSDDLSYVLGLDYMGFRDWFLSAQLFQSHLTNHSPDMVRPKTDTNITLLARRDLMNETMQAEALLVHNLNQGDGLLQLSLSYEWSTSIRFKAGADIFYGNKKGLYGQFKENDRITAGIEFAF